MRLSIKIIVGAAVVAASVVAGTLGASAPAAAAAGKDLGARATETAVDMSSARRRSMKSNRGTSRRVSRLSRRAVEPPNPNRPYYYPVPPFFPFAQDRGYF